MSKSKVVAWFYVLLAACVLLWPALYNGYPLVYSDSHVFISQPVAGFMNWDKPYVYGPLILLWHGWFTLWGVVFAQGLLISHLVWLSARVFGASEGLRHLLVCAVLGITTSLPWFVSFVMPDIFSAITVLCIFLLAFASRLTTLERYWLVLVGALAIAVHLSNLVLAAGCLFVVFALRVKGARVALLTLVAAIMILLATNFYSFQKIALSPHGSVFMLARLTGDGNTKEVLEKYCAQKKWYLCEWMDRLPEDSDDFLWNGKGPVWSHPGGPIGLAPEATEIVGYVVRTRPVEVLRSALRNTLTQLKMIQLGDTLHRDHLDVTVAKSIRQYFSATELESFLQSRQMKGTLGENAIFFSVLNQLFSLVGLLFGVFVLFQAVRQYKNGEFTDSTRLAVSFILVIWMGLCANAFATGALSKPHHRYQARISWLLLLPPLLMCTRAVKRSPESLAHSR